MGELIIVDGVFNSMTLENLWEFILIAKSRTVPDLLMPQSFISFI